MRHNCEQSGCYLTKVRWNPNSLGRTLEGRKLPRGCSATDIDGFNEINGRFLVVESKPETYERSIGGQEKALRKLVIHSDRFSVLWQRCEHQADDSVTALRLYYRDPTVASHPLDTGWFDADARFRDELWHEWGWWADERPGEQHPWTLLRVALLVAA